MTERPNVLIVCTGNLCRSPLAAAVLERELATAGIDAAVSSSGTAAPLDVAPDRKLLRVADELGVDLRAHRSRPLDRKDLAGADLVLTMTGRHRDAVVALDAAHAAITVPLRTAVWKASILRGRPVPFGTWVARLVADAPVAERPVFDPSNYIPDPMGGPLREYRAMAQEVNVLVGTLIARWSGR